MNEYILAEFAISKNGISNMNEYLRSLGDDFQFVNLTVKGHDDAIITGKIRADTATTIKLRDDAVSQCMRVSFISDDLKNKYRINTK